MLRTHRATNAATKRRADRVVNQKAMKSVLANVLLVALTAAACGTVNAPAEERGAPQPPVRAGTAAPVAPPSPATDAIPVNDNAAPATTVPSRPMADNEATNAPVPNAPAQAIPQATDRCAGPGTPDPKVPPPACPPQ
jgi:hypothetical protein